MTGWPAFDETVSWGGDTGVPDMLVSEAKAAGGRAVYLPADLGSVEAIPQIFDRAQGTLGPVIALVVVHNYETEASAGLFDVTPAEFDRSMAINPAPPCSSRPSSGGGTPGPRAAAASSRSPAGSR